jgi:hypothetical protein
MAPRLKSERQRTANDVRTFLQTKGIMPELASQVLLKILDDYVDKGTPYINKELTILGSSPGMRTSVASKFVVNLYNDRQHTDTVVLRPRTS